MNYEKQTWETGQVITAEKLNHMEDGISQSEGGSVISLGQYNGGTSNNYFSGGGAYSGNLASIIGNRTIVNSFAMVDDGTSQHQKWTGRFSILSDGVNYNPVTDQEILRTITSGVGVNFDIPYMGTIESGAKAELYIVLV